MGQSEVGSAFLKAAVMGTVSFFYPTQARPGMPTQHSQQIHITLSLLVLPIDKSFLVSINMFLVVSP